MPYRYMVVNLMNINANINLILCCEIIFLEPTFLFR